MLTKEEIEAKGWTVVPKGVWFGLDYGDDGSEVLDKLTGLLELDTDVQGYNFLVIGYAPEENDDD